MNNLIKITNPLALSNAGQNNFKKQNITQKASNAAYGIFRNVIQRAQREFDKIYKPNVNKKLKRCVPLFTIIFPLFVHAVPIEINGIKTDVTIRSTLADEEELKRRIKEINNLFDNNSQTVWFISEKKRSNAGSDLTIEMKFSETQKIEGLAIWAGAQSNVKEFAKYSVPTEIELTLFGDNSPVDQKKFEQRHLSYKRNEYVENNLVKCPHTEDNSNLGPHYLIFSSPLHARELKIRFHFLAEGNSDSALAISDLRFFFSNAVHTTQTVDHILNFLQVMRAPSNDNPVLGKNEAYVDLRKKFSREWVWNLGSEREDVALTYGNYKISPTYPSNKTTSPPTIVPRVRLEERESHTQALWPNSSVYKDGFPPPVVSKKSRNKWDKYLAYVQPLLLNQFVKVNSKNYGTILIGAPDYSSDFIRPTPLIHLSPEGRVVSANESVAGGCEKFSEQPVWLPKVQKGKK